MFKITPNTLFSCCLGRSSTSCFSTNKQYLLVISPSEKKQYLPVILLWVEAGELPHQDGVAALDENSENGASDEDLVTSDAGGSIPQAQLDEMDSDHDLVDNVDKQLMRCKLSIELEIKTSCHQSRLVLTEE
ncbi:uncharacterized protein LOC141712046 isoform X1 [Apium graveolens]|uniref:uncharacterized protein LOC141712046 isoform X1 n=1 Tax=Apium graveolens TaxID=4045 RepID=UPI003D7AAC9A